MEGVKIIFRNHKKFGFRCVKVLRRNGENYVHFTGTPAMGRKRRLIIT